MSVWVLEVTGVAAPERVVRPLDDDGARGFGLGHRRIDFGFRRNVVPEGERRRARGAGSDSGVMSDTRSRPERELQTCLQVEERHSAIFELSSEDPIGLETEAVTVETVGILAIVTGESTQRAITVY